MEKTQASIMAATIGSSTEGLERVDAARRKKGWTKYAQVWADLAQTSPATLRRFWAGVRIRTETFRSICEAVGIDDWEAIIDKESKDNLQDKGYSKRLSFAIAGSIEETDKKKLDAIVALLQKLTGDTDIEVLDVDEGSIKLILGSSPEALRRIADLFDSGVLKDVEGTPVEDVHFLSTEELVKWIKKNPGDTLNLSGANLERANLERANLERANLERANLVGANLVGANLGAANLEGANLVGANLEGANLVGANLEEANLEGANLEGANLGGANLEEANLGGANLGGANLGGANLGGANLEEANLGGANLRGANLRGANLEGAYLKKADVLNTDFTDAFGLEEERVDLEEKGAIFGGPGSSDRSRVRL